MSNEITAIPALLELLVIIGCIVTLDAMGTQKTIAVQIQQAQADYILCLKANHPTVFEQLDAWFKMAIREASSLRLIASGTLPMLMDHTTVAGHHRTEIRKVWTFSLDQLPPLHQAAILDGTANDCHGRMSWSNAPAICEIKPLMKFSFLSAVCLQTVPELPVPFVSTGALKIRCTGRSMSPEREDDCRVRSLHAPHNLALVRRFAINTLNP